MGHVKNLFTIAPHLPFLDQLAHALWQRHDGDGFRLSQTLILLPTRRACRHLGESFARLAGGKPVLLPRMRPLGDSDEDEIIMTDSAAFDIPPSIDPIKRLMLLTQQVQRRDPSLSCDQAAEAAAALARFLDQVQIEQCDLGNLPKLVERRELAEHWQQTLRFLDIVTQFWPKILASHGCIDPAERRNAVLAAQSALWQKQPPAFPVIAAGSTGSVPATATLLNVIASLPDGAVILPGLDRDLDADAWQEIDDTHPQHSMKRLLEKMAVDRHDVRDWGTSPSLSPSHSHSSSYSYSHSYSPRAALINLAMRPARLTDQWRNWSDKMDPACTHGLERVTLDHPQEEAQVIALRLRNVLETPDQTAALVTADRGLAARVAALLRRWSIEVDDSGGASLASLPTGSFLNLVLAAASPFAGDVDRLALLKHPIAACGQHPAACRAWVREAEIRLRQGKEEKFETLTNLLEPLRQKGHHPLPLTERIALHIATAEHIAQSASETGAARLWRGERGIDSAAWFDTWRDSADDFPALSGGDYAALFNMLATYATLRSARSAHPRLSILGPLEARLINADLVILGGMNEGVWPPDPGFDPWMSRPMRHDFGLPAPEFRIGLSAHDFTHLACAKQVLITRSLRTGGTPTAPSRFILQIEAVLRATGLSDATQDRLAPTLPWQKWAQQIDRPEVIQPCARPQPRPPVSSRPTTLSVTDIGTWLRNPYAIYARYILGLKKLDELDAELDASDRGTMIHSALEQFLRENPDSLPPDATARLTAISRTVFASALHDPRVQAFWWARFTDIAAWFVDYEQTRRASGLKLAKAEATGRITIDGLTLTGRADRIDILDRAMDASLSIIDYKTGGVPTAKQVNSGIEPQLQLLGLIAEKGGFTNIAPASVGSLEYWRLQGGRSGCKTDIYDAPDKIADLIAQAESGLKKLIAGFADPNTPYEAVPKPRLQPRYNDYAHVARLAEWGRSSGLEDE